MDDFILPEDIDEENIGNMDLDAVGSRVTVLSGDDRELGRSDNVLSVGRCAQAMGNTLRKFEEVKKRTAEVDRLAMQLSFGIRLQAEMDKCASDRRNFPLHMALKRKKLSSGLSLLIIQLRNRSSFEMIGWHLALTTSSYRTSTIERKDETITKIIPIKQLSQHSEFNYERICNPYMITNEKLSAVSRSNEKYLQILYIDMCPRCREPLAFRIALEPIYLTHWETVSITAVPENTISRLVQYARVDEEQKITLPEALVYLICDEKQTETTLLSWIISTVTDGCDSVNCVVLDDENVRWPFAVQVKKRGLNYDVVLRMKNAKMRCTLIDELKIRILIRMRYVWKELKEKEDCELLLDKNSLTDYFVSLVAKYKR